MKTYQIHNAKVTLTEQPMPECAADQVLVKMHALALNHRD